MPMEDILPQLGSVKDDPGVLFLSPPPHSFLCHSHYPQVVQLVKGRPPNQGEDGRGAEERGTLDVAKNQLLPQGELLDEGEVVGGINSELSWQPPRTHRSAQPFTDFPGLGIVGGNSRLARGPCSALAPSNPYTFPRRHAVLHFNIQVVGHGAAFHLHTREAPGNVHPS